MRILLLLFAVVIYACATSKVEKTDFDIFYSENNEVKDRYHYNDKTKTRTYRYASQPDSISEEEEFEGIVRDRFYKSVEKDVKNKEDDEEDDDPVIMVKVSRITKPTNGLRAKKSNEFKDVPLEERRKLHRIRNEKSISTKRMIEFCRKWAKKNNMEEAMEKFIRKSMKRQIEEATLRRKIYEDLGAVLQSFEEMIVDENLSSEDRARLTAEIVKDQDSLVKNAFDVILSAKLDSSYYQTPFDDIDNEVRMRRSIGHGAQPNHHKKSHYHKKVPFDLGRNVVFWVFSSLDW
ncbi:unnamed protein product [Caenorhabditis bovis]|uniref:SXP/RAL-2 family protein Ani s 5-like cation-binding domain-containing protein n=1 Tax=Caenorhabditis bovis TaxID=2654633 RepID=A0A8S1F6V4_9PELO|nr:unnamed protein product [Caenorhabditis bovis]